MSPFLLAVLAQGAIHSAPAPQPDFSGVWVLDPARSETLQAGGRIDRGPLVVTQTGASFRIAPPPFGHADAPIPIVASAASGAAAGAGAAYWEGPALVTQIERMINGKSVVLQQSRTLAPSGAEMVVETTLAIQHGYAPGEPLPKSTARDIYVRTSR